MNETIVKVFGSPDGQERVAIILRGDGIHSYRRQWRAVEMNNNTDSPIFEAGSMAAGKWGPFGPYCGFYDSAETAEYEATNKISWMRAPI